MNWIKMKKAKVASFLVLFDMSQMDVQSVQLMILNKE